ncbi:MAG: SUF system NifU family Fe-S cluster assembly protein [Candidatus Micrarchaeota archaeon]|nr:SUF system NifU family Fe-S cluster assembly protein [Candidatus Micrarchaeota archaeon]MDE1823670.1 SUF system NifU family Fe-S cluster assembly protein [Candidatus Micrarchaeota archaeon]MDE1849967.1 SUF system NifU family Fe-S cluster assembly protein [Candidatus Micrarchaeota archaeon]
MDLDMYAEELLYSYEHPHNKGKLEGADAEMHEENISCGDKITVYLKIEDGKVSDVKFEGSGCVISMGSASMLTESIKGKSVAELESMGKTGLLQVIGIDPGPVRMHCATLSLRAVKEAVFKYDKKPVDKTTKEL